MRKTLTWISSILATIIGYRLVSSMLEDKRDFR